MVSQMFFHPHHMIPSTKFVPTLIKLSHEPISHMPVKGHAVWGKVFVGLFGIGNAGVYWCNALFCLPVSISALHASSIFRAASPGVSSPFSKS